MIDWDSYTGKGHNLSTMGNVNTFREYLNGSKGDGNILNRKGLGRYNKTSNNTFIVTAWQYLNDNPWGDVSNHCFNQLEQYI